MKLSLISVTAAMLLVACASSQLAHEPADLIAPGSSISALSNLGWKISPPVSAADATIKDQLSPASASSSNGQSWESFVAKLAPGHKLRPVRNNAGVGYAIFRGGALVDLYLVTVF
jgi:hypothetical protein